jgi:hypothetical protein
MVMFTLLVQLGAFADGLVVTWRSPHAKPRLALEALCSGAVLAWCAPLLLELCPGWSLPLIGLGDLWLLVIGLAALLASWRRGHARTNGSGAARLDR